MPQGTQNNYDPRKVYFRVVRDWSLIMGRGGGYKMGGGAETVLAMLKGGHNKFWGSFYVLA